MAPSGARGVVRQGLSVHRGGWLTSNVGAKRGLPTPGLPPSDKNAEGSALHRRERRLTPPVRDFEIICTMLSAQRGDHRNDTARQRRLHGGGLGPRLGCVVSAVRIMGWGNCTQNSADFLAASDGCGGSVPVTPNPHPRGLAGELSACRLGPRCLLARPPTPACVADHGRTVIIRHEVRSSSVSR